MTCRQDDAAVLRRRRMQLAAEREYTPAWLEVFTRAADALEMFTAGGSAQEDLMLRLMGDNRLLRKALAAVNELVTIVTVPFAQQARAKALIQRALTSAEPVGVGRDLLVIEVRPTDTRAQVDAGLATVLDDHFAARAATTTQPIDAGAAVIDDASTTQPGGSS